MRDRVALITGGAGNLGRVVTRVFLEAGVRVAVPLHGTDSPDTMLPLREAHGDRLLSFGMDLTTERGAAAAVDQAVEWGERLDVVVHLVGGYAGGKRLADVAVETWDEMFLLNLRSAFLVARASLPVMCRERYGVLLFISSRAARVDRGKHGPYAIAKAGLLTLAETIAEEYRHDGVRAHALLPGTLDTDDNRRAMPDADHDRWTDPEAVARLLLLMASPGAAVANGAAIPAYGRS